MKNLTEAYNQIYQLDEVSFTNVGGLRANVMRGIARKSDEQTPPPAPQLPPPTTASPTTPQPSAMDQWRAANPKLAAAADEKARIRGTNQTDNPLIDAEMRSKMPAPTKGQDPNFQTIMKSGKYGDQGHQSLTQNSYAKVTSTLPTTTTAKPIPPTVSALGQAAAASIEKDPKAQQFDTSKWFSNRSTRNDRKKPLLQTQMNSYDYGQIDQEQLSSMVDAYASMYANQEKEEVETEELEEKRGLWDNIHAKRKRGERPAKPGEKGYPKTLNVEESELEEGLKQARKNVGAKKCWDGYKAKGTKMKGDKEVPNCVPEAYDIILDHLMSEGYASNLKDAENIMTVMSENWMREILNEFDSGVARITYAPGRSLGLNISGAGGTPKTGQYDANLGITRYAAGRQVTDASIAQGIAHADQNLGQAGETSIPIGAKTVVTGGVNYSGSIPPAQKPIVPITQKPVDKTKTETKTEVKVSPETPKPPDSVRRVSTPVSPEISKQPDVRSDSVRSDTYSPVGTDINKQVDMIRQAANSVGNGQMGAPIAMPGRF